MGTDRPPQTGGNHETRGWLLKPSYNLCTEWAQNLPQTNQIVWETAGILGSASQGFEVNGGSWCRGQARQPASSPACWSASPLPAVCCDRHCRCPPQSLSLPVHPTPAAGLHLRPTLEQHDLGGWESATTPTAASSAPPALPPGSHEARRLPCSAQSPCWISLPCLATGSPEGQDTLNRSHGPEPMPASASREPRRATPAASCPIGTCPYSAAKWAHAPGSAARIHGAETRVALRRVCGTQKELREVSAYHQCHWIQRYSSYS